MSSRYQVRSTGPINKLTKQPVKGRKVLLQISSSMSLTFYLGWWWHPCRRNGARRSDISRRSVCCEGPVIGVQRHLLRRFMLHMRLDAHEPTRCAIFHSHHSAAGDMTISFETKCPRGFPTDFCLQRVTCRYCGTGAGVVSVIIPYVLRYLASELAAMNIKPVCLRRNRVLNARYPCPPEISK